MPRPQPPSAPVPEMPVDLDQLAVDLGQGPPPSAAVRPVLDLSSFPDKLAELTAILQDFARVGVVERRADGSFMPAGMQDPRAAQIAAQGSECRCPQCHTWDQRHWYCAGPGCYSGPHEWVIDGPKAEPHYVLGERGQGGVAYHFCHAQCRVNFLNELHARRRVPPAELEGIPYAP